MKASLKIQVDSACARWPCRCAARCKTSTGAVSVAPLLLVDLKTERRHRRAAPICLRLSKAHLKPLAALVEAMAEMLKGDAVAPFEIEKKLRARYTLLGVHNIVLFAMAAIDMCAWDALGQALGQPVVRLLGGAPRPVPAYNSNGLGIQELKPLAKEAEQLVAEGFSAVKLRLGTADGEGGHRGAARGEEGHRPEGDADGGLQPGAHASPRRSGAAA